MLYCGCSEINILTFIFPLQRHCSLSMFCLSLIKTFILMIGSFYSKQGALRGKNKKKLSKIYTRHVWGPEGTMGFCINIPGDRRVKREFTRRSCNKWTKMLCQGFCLANFRVTVFISSQKNSFLPSPLNKFWRSNEKLENTDEMKLIMKFCLCLRNFPHGTF